jgi:uncharacterized membrane protein
VLGLLAAGWLILSSLAHSILGWKQLQSALGAAKVPADLTLALKFIWQFAGVAMLAFGILALMVFVKARRDPAIPGSSVIVIGAAYTAFGAWAMIASKLDLFFLIFLVPGILLILASPAWSTSRDP